MSEDCIFCQIVDGEIPGRIVYEDDDAVAFLDANPMAPGHTLVVPRTHHETLGDLPADEGEAVFAALHRLAPVVEAAVDADASTVAFNNGEAAGQEVPHVHGHVIPRFEGDGGGPIHTVAGSRPDLSDADLDDIADDIASAAE
jgi:histidine triad (HIT) family protein